jgi:hypothetical protein
MIQQTSDNNKKLLPSEELLWHRILTKGIFRKKIIEGLLRFYVVLWTFALQILQLQKY